MGALILIDYYAKKDVTINNFSNEVIKEDVINKHSNVAGAWVHS